MLTLAGSQTFKLSVRFRKMKRLMTLFLLLGATGCSREQPRGTIHNLRGIEWAREQGEAMVVTNFGGLPGGGECDFIRIKDNRRQRNVGYISVSGQWLEVVYPPYVQRALAGREGDYTFPQRDTNGTPVARALSAGGRVITHIFRNGKWTESNQASQAIGAPSAPLPKR